MVLNISDCQKSDSTPDSCPHPKQNQQGFTLIELLVVIAVIAIIAALLFPVFVKIREKGRQITCASNLRQLSVAFSLYTQDSDDILPSVTDGQPGVGVLGGWLYYSQFSDAPSDTPAIFNVTKGSLYPYVNNKSVYICPDDNKGHKSGASYALNSCLLPTSSALLLEPKPGSSLASVSAPAITLLLCEEDADYTTHLTGSTDDGVLSLEYDNSVSIRHSHGSNLAFVDGHVKWYTLASSVGNPGARNSADVVTLLQTGGVSPTPNNMGGAVCP